MTVKAKFTFQSYSTSLHSQWDAEKKQSKSPVELRTLKFSPVYGNNDPNHENTKFFNASPSGSIELGTVNPAAWNYFKLGATYMLEFTEADPPPVVVPTDTP